MFSVSFDATVLKFYLTKMSLPGPDPQIKLFLAYKSLRTRQLIRNLFKQDASQLLFGILSNST